MSLKLKAKEVDGNYVLDGITIGRVTDLKPNEWFGKVELASMPEFAEYGYLDPMAIVKGDDGVTYKDPKGGSDGSRGTLLEPDGTPVVNVTSYDKHEDFMNDLFRESKANEEQPYDSLKSTGCDTHGCVDGVNVLDGGYCKGCKGTGKNEESKANEYEEELPDERSESELETDTSYEDSIYGDPFYASSDPRNWYKKGSQWKVVGDDPDDIDELTGESKANEEVTFAGRGEITSQEELWNSLGTKRRMWLLGIALTDEDPAESEFLATKDWSEVKHIIGEPYFDLQFLKNVAGVESKANETYTKEQIEQAKKVGGDYPASWLEQSNKMEDKAHPDPESFPYDKDEYIPLAKDEADEDYDDDLFTSGDYIGMVSSGDEEEGFKFLDDYFGIGSEITNRPRKDVDFDKLVRTIEKKLDLGSSDDRDAITFAKKWLGESKANEEKTINGRTKEEIGKELDEAVNKMNSISKGDSPYREDTRSDAIKLVQKLEKEYNDVQDEANENSNWKDSVFGLIANRSEIECIAEAENFGYSCATEIFMHVFGTTKVTPEQVKQAKFILENWDLHNLHPYKTKAMYFGNESKANENSNWKAFTNAQRQEIIDLADVSVSADTEWEDISVPDQEDLSIQLVSQGALANADFTGFADEYVNEIKLDGLNIKNHVRETLRDNIHNWKKMDRDVRKEDSEMAGIDQDIIDTIVDMSLGKIKKQFPEEHKKLDQIGVWGLGESKASEASEQDVIGLIRIMEGGISARDINSSLGGSSGLDEEEHGGVGEILDRLSQQGVIKYYGDKWHITESKAKEYLVYCPACGGSGVSRTSITSESGSCEFCDGDGVISEDGESKASPEYLHQQRRRLLAKAEEDRVCPVCGEKSPYVRMGDFWETHFADKHRLNESKANEVNIDSDLDNYFMYGITHPDYAECKLCGENILLPVGDIGAKFTLLQHLVREHPNQGNRVSKKLLTDESIAGEYSDVEEDMDMREEQQVGSPEADEESIDDNVGESKASEYELYDEDWRRHEINNPTLFLNQTIPNRQELWDKEVERYDSLIPLLADINHVKISKYQFLRGSDNEEIAEAVWNMKQALGESKANEDWLDDQGYDYAEPTYQQKMEMRTFVQKNFVPVQKQTSVPEYGDDQWEYTRDSADFGEHYDIRCKLCGRVFDAGADKNGVAEQHVRSEHSIDVFGISHKQFEESKASEDGTSDGAKKGWWGRKLSNAPAVHDEEPSDTSKFQNVIESKANEGDWDHINAEDEAELDSQITTLEVAYYKEDDVNEQTNILGELERLRGIKRKFESGELPNTLANEDGMYANFGKRSKEDSWSVLTVASDLMWFETREEAEDYMKNWDRSSYQISPPKSGRSNWNKEGESKANEYNPDDFGEGGFIVCPECNGTGNTKAYRQSRYGGLRHPEYQPDIDGSLEEYNVRCSQCNGVGKINNPRWSKNDNMGWVLNNESKANENVASKMAYYYQKDAPKDWNDNQVSNEAEKILEETYGIKPKKEVVKEKAEESLSTVQQKIVDRKLDGVRNESIIHELKIWDNMSEEQATKAVETTEIPLKDSIAYTLFNKKYAECNENEIQELKIYAGESKVKAEEHYGVGTPAGDIIWKHFNEVHSMDQDDVFCNHCGKQMTEQVRVAGINGDGMGGLAQQQVYFDHLANNHNISYESKATEVPEPYKDPSEKLEYDPNWYDFDEDGYNSKGYNKDGYDKDEKDEYGKYAWESKANEESYPSPMISKGQQYTKDSFLGFKGHNPTIAICKKCGWEAGALSDKDDSQDNIVYDKIHEHVASMHGLVRSNWVESYVRKAKYTGNEGISLADWSKFQDEHGWYRVGVSSPSPDVWDTARSMGGNYYGISSSGYGVEEWSFHNYSDAENFAQYVEAKSQDVDFGKGLEPMEQHYVEGPSDVSPIVFSGGQSHNIGSGAIGGHPLRDNPFGTESKKVNKRRRGA